MPPRKRTSASSKTAAKTAPTRRRTSAVTASPFGAPELIVVADPAAALRIGTRGVESGGGADTRALNRVAARAAVTLRPLFGPEDRVRLEARNLAPAAIGPVPDLSVYYHVDAPVGDLADLAEELAGSEGVQAAYVKPASEPPVLNDMAPAGEDAPPTTPDFVGNQLYLEAAPGGVDARYAWTWPGGGGAGVEHHRLRVGLAVRPRGSRRRAGRRRRRHGERGHQPRNRGHRRDQRRPERVRHHGDLPRRLHPGGGLLGPDGVRRSTAPRDKLGAGDIILLEIHRAGPRHNFQARSDQLGYIAIEWWPDDFDAIRYANSRGIIVVEAAGNGAREPRRRAVLGAAGRVPDAWTNPFNRANRDSGAVVVGAGAPPPGTHGVSWGADRSRLDFSNYGALIDAQGWGREVTQHRVRRSAGRRRRADLVHRPLLRDLQRVSDRRRGRSARLQGALRAAGKTPMTPATARAWLRATGSPQQDEPGRPATQRIGNRPDLKALIQAHVKGNIAIDKATFKDAKDVKLEHKELKNEKAEIKERKEKIEVKEHKVEAKELKNEKAEIKERKEKIEVIEGKHLIVDGGGKNLVVEGGGGGGKQLVEGGGGGFGGGGIDPASAAGAGVEARLAAVEQSVAALTHFIGADLRPELGSGALAREADLSAEPDAPKSFKDSKDSKDSKDMKDQENLGGY